MGALAQALGMPLSIIEDTTKPTMPETTKVLRIDETVPVAELVTPAQVIAFLLANVPQLNQAVEAQLPAATELATQHRQQMAVRSYRGV